MSKMVQNMKANGILKLIKKTVKDIKYGLMVLFTKDIGKMAKLMVEGG